MVAYDVTFEFRLTSRSVEVKVAVVKHEGVARGGGGAAAPGAGWGGDQMVSNSPVAQTEIG